MNPERSNIEASESKEKSLGIKVEYQYTDAYGRVFGSGRIDVERLPPCPEGASRFDGYVETPFGQFAFQGRVSEFQTMLDDIKNYCQKKSESEQVLNDLKDAENDHQVSVSRYQRTYETERWIATNSKVEETQRKKSILEKEIGDLQNKTAKYRI